MRWLLVASELPRKFWFVAAFLLFAGCSGGSVAVGTLDVSSFVGSVPGLVAAFVAISQAYRFKARAGAAIEEAAADTARAVARTLMSRDTEVTQLRLLVEAAIGRDLICQQRLSAMEREFRLFREEHLSQRSDR